jgi:hypothetical protein
MRVYFLIDKGAKTGRMKDASTAKRQDTLLVSAPKTRTPANNQGSTAIDQDIVAGMITTETESILDRGSMGIGITVITIEPRGRGKETIGLIGANSNIEGQGGHLLSVRGLTAIIEDGATTVPNLAPKAISVDTGTTGMAGGTMSETTERVLGIVIDGEMNLAGEEKALTRGPALGLLVDDMDTTKLNY